MMAHIEVQLGPGRSRTSVTAWVHGGTQPGADRQVTARVSLYSTRFSFGTPGPQGRQIPRLADSESESESRWQSAGETDEPEGQSRYSPPAAWAGPGQPRGLEWPHSDWPMAAT